MPFDIKRYEECAREQLPTVIDPKLIADTFTVLYQVTPDIQKFDASEEIRITLGMDRIIFFDYRIISIDGFRITWELVNYRRSN